MDPIQKDEKIIDILDAQGFSIYGEKENRFVLFEGQRFKVQHPAKIYLSLYKDLLYQKNSSPELKYEYLTKAYFLLFPQYVDTWNYWSERRFKAHCGFYGTENWRMISWAGCASSAKSWDGALLAFLFWISNPREHAVVVASTTLSSLDSRIYGYIKTLYGECAVKPPGKSYAALPPKILNSPKNGTVDTIHGIFALAAKEGADTKTINTWIGRHPKKAMMVILDEGTEMPLAILDGLVNLEGQLPFFQVVIIGNSSSKNDLHGLMSTPVNGFESIDTTKEIMWKTSQNRGLCLFFNAYESPALVEPDPIKKEMLGRFLPTRSSLDAKEKQYGKNSDAFFRFVLGFWRSERSGDTILSKEFINEHGLMRTAEWSGLYPLIKLAGLDPAFTGDGDKCVLRFATLGHTTSGMWTIDLGGYENILALPINPMLPESPEKQIGVRVIQELSARGMGLDSLVIDASGIGMGLAEIIHLLNNGVGRPLKIRTSWQGITTKKSHEFVQVQGFDMWNNFHKFGSHGQVKGLDESTVLFLTLRKVIYEGNKMTPVLEKKRDFNKRIRTLYPSLAHSPDEADAAALIMVLAVERFGFYPGWFSDSTPRGSEENLFFEKLQQYELMRKTGLSPTEINNGANSEKYVDYNSDFIGEGGSIDTGKWELS